jgi:hypothetical protein
MLALLLAGKQASEAFLRNKHRRLIQGAESMSGIEQRGKAPGASVFTRFRTWLRTPLENKALDTHLVRFWESVGLPFRSRASPSAVNADYGTPPNEMDDRLANRLWLELAEECVLLYDELDRHRFEFDPARQELVDHVCLRLQEILERSGIDTIMTQDGFDRQRHQIDEAGSSARTGSRIVEVESPGFAVGPRVLRRARVRLSESELLKGEVHP